jgi:hypothetical protein
MVSKIRFSGLTEMAAWRRSTPGRVFYPQFLAIPDTQPFRPLFVKASFNNFKSAKINLDFTIFSLVSDKPS